MPRSTAIAYSPSLPRLLVRGNHRGVQRPQGLVLAARPKGWCEEKVARDRRHHQNPNSPSLSARLRLSTARPERTRIRTKIGGLDFSLLRKSRSVANRLRCRQVRDPSHRRRLFKTLRYYTCISKKPKSICGYIGLISHH